MAAVATRQQAAVTSGPASRINSPVDTKKANISNEETKRNSPKTKTRDITKAAPKTSTRKASNTSTTNSKTEKAVESAQPVATTTTDAATVTTPDAAVVSTAAEAPQTTRETSLPPPPPPPAAIEETSGDYFSAVHHNKYGEEPNPFEQSFSVNDGLTPGKAILPPASSITSPSPNLGPGNFNWGIHSLRSGPLSPAMLTGPSNTFDASIRTGLTPNESGIRSGLTPGGSGSMFPAPSPNTQAIFGFSSGTTPGTMEFHKTALAAAQQQANRGKMVQGGAPMGAKPDGDPMEGVTMAPAVKPNTAQVKASHGRQASDPFGVDANAAASGLYMLAQQSQHPNDAQQPFMANANIPNGVPPPQAAPNPVIGLGIDPTHAAAVNRIQTSDKHIANGRRGPRGSSEGMEEAGLSDSTDGNAAVRGVKGKAGKKGAAAQNAKSGMRRKAEEAKGPAGKKVKNEPISNDDVSDSGEDDHMEDQTSGQTDPKKMTDEEKRKNFLERNRVAALKCRQRKKQWLANLQAKVEYYGAENDALTSQVTTLREEIVKLQTLLLAHKDCPISRTAGPQAMGGLETIAALGQGPDYGSVHHPYGVPVSMAPPGPRRFS